MSSILDSLSKRVFSFAPNSLSFIVKLSKEGQTDTMGEITYTDPDKTVGNLAGMDLQVR